MNHPINELFKFSTSSVKDMANVDMIIGKPIFMENGIIVTPVSKVKLTFATGGLESKMAVDELTPFGGLTGSTITIDPVCFIVCNGIDVDILHVNEETHLYEKIIDQIPEITAKIKKMFTKESSSKV